MLLYGRNNKTQWDRQYAFGVDDPMETANDAVHACEKKKNNVNFIHDR